MKKFISFLSLAIAFLSGNYAMAYDFSAECSTGQTLYYNITSNEEPYTVEVTKENTEYPYYTTYPTGELEIPETVEYNSIIYSVTSIGVLAFYNCSGLITVEISNSVTEIDNNAFSGCSSLSSLTIPNSVTSIGESAFSGCSGLETISVGLNNTIYDSRDNCNAIIETATNSLIVGCKNTLIPYSVTSISYNSFTGCSELTSIAIPSSIISIGMMAFYGCSELTSITIPESVTSIGEDAFHGTGWYNNQTDGILYLENWCLGYKGNMPTGDLVLEETRGIADDAFRDCSELLSITIPNTVIYICNASFQGCSGMTGELTIPNSVTRIGGWAFQGCTGLSTLIIGSSVESIGDGAFNACSGLTSVSIGNSVISIGEGAFGECRGLTEITIPNSVAILGNSIFFNCIGLTSVTIGNSVESIGTAAFTGCSNIININIFANMSPVLGDGAFSETTYTNALLLVPCSTAESYSTADGWRNFNNIQERIPYSLNVSSDNEQQGTASVTQQPNCSDSIAIIEAIPNQGYRFLSWNDGNTDNPRTITVTSDSTFVATFRTRAGNSDILCNEPCPVTTDQTMSQTNIPYYAPEELSYRAGDQVEICVTIQCPTTISVNNMGGTITSLAINELENVPSGFTYCVSNTELDPTNYAFATIWFTGVATEAGEYNIRIGGDLTGTLNSTPVTEEAVSIETGINITIYSENSKIIRVLSNNDAYGSVSGGGFYDENWEAVISATPNQGYRFVQWNDGNTDNPRTIIVTEDATYTAIFEASTYTITAIAGENGTISPSGEVTVVEGENQSFTITANDGYRISSVLVDETEDVTNQVENGVYTFENVTASHDIEATFEAIPSASFTTNPEASGDTLSIMLEQLVEYTSTSINAHHIVWTFEGTDTVESTQTYVPVRYSEEGVFLTTLVAYNEDETLTDTATLTVVVREASYYTITAVSANDAYGSVSGGGTYAEGTTATLTATPNQGYRFASWDDGNTNNPRTITVTSDSTFVANFARSSNSSSDIQAKFYADADATVEAGTSMTIPMEEDFVIYPALYNGGPDVATDSVYVDIQVNGSSILQDDVHFLSLESDPIEADNIKFILAQNALTFTAADLDQAALSSFEICFIANYSGNDLNTENNTVCVTVTRQRQYTITALANNDEYGSVSGSGTYDEGSTVILTAMPYDGNCFLSWEDDENADNPRTITVTSDSTFIANFSAPTHIEIDTTVTKFVTIGDHTFYAAGQYSFVIPVEIGCDTIVDLNLHVLDEPEVYDISPNPAKSIISISSDDYISYVEFYTSTGRPVMRKEINAKQAEINVEGFAPGIYFVRLYGEEGSLPTVQKFIKE